MFEIEYEKNFIYNKLQQSENALLFILPCKNIKFEETLAITKAKELEVPMINVGLVIAEFLSKGYIKNYLSQEIIELLDNLILKTKDKNFEKKKSLILLYNIGILWEKDLSLNLEMLFKKILKQTSLILVWSGFVDTLKNKIFLLDSSSLYYKQLNEMTIYSCKE